MLDKKTIVKFELEKIIDKNYHEMQISGESLPKFKLLEALIRSSSFHH